MFRLKLDLFSEHSEESNPDFEFETIKELYSFMKICFANGYSVLISEE